jgi:hypothetical protein
MQKRLQVLLAHVPCYRDHDEVHPVCHRDGQAPLLLEGHTRGLASRGNCREAAAHALETGFGRVEDLASRVESHATQVDHIQCCDRLVGQKRRGRFECESLVGSAKRVRVGRAAGLKRVENYQVEVVLSTALKTRGRS